jgi:hypothetical protein
LPATVPAAFPEIGCSAAVKVVASEDEVLSVALAVAGGLSPGFVALESAAAAVWSGLGDEESAGVSAAVDALSSTGHEPYLRIGATVDCYGIDRPVVTTLVAFARR